MKRILTTVCLLIMFLLSTKAQSNFIIGVLYGYGFMGLCENSDSTVTLAGVALDTIYNGPAPNLQSGVSGVSFAKYDRFGNEILRRVYGGLLNDRSGTIIPLNEPNGINYMIIGESWSFSPLPPNSYQQAYLLKVNSSGDTIWTRGYDIGFISYLSFLVANDSTYMLAGANGLAATLTKINPIDGDTIWTRWYKQTIAQTIAATSILPADSGFYLGGSVIPPGANNDYFMLLKTDSAGILQWGKAYGTNLRPLQSWDIIKLSTSELLMVGQTDINSPSDIGIIKLNAVGDTVWCHKYSFPFNIYDIGCTALEDNDGNYVIAGYDGNNGKAQLFKLDTNGNVMWAWKYNWGGHESMTIKKAYDGGYWIASGALVKLDSTGYGCTAIPQTIVKRSFPINIVPISPQMDGGAKACIRTNTTEYINTIPVGDLCIYLGVDENEKSNDEFSVYPNPVSDKLSVSIPISVGSQLTNSALLTVTIYDVLGKQKLQQPFAAYDGKLSLDVGDLSSGIYFISVEQKGKVLNAKFAKE